MSPAQARTLRLLFAVLQGVPPLAARAAFHLFLRTYRHPLRPADAAQLAQATAHRLTAGADAFDVHEWPGPGPTVLILHGWGSAAARFTLLARAFAEQGWRVLVMEAPGHGGSPGRTSSLPQFIAAMDAVIARFGPVHGLVGHSLGGLAIAARFAAGPPDWAATLRGVVLVSTPSGAPFLVDSFLSLLGLRAASAMRMQRCFQRRFGASPEGFLAAPGVARMRMPLLVVHDRLDDVIPFAQAEALQRANPAARLLATEGLGHSALTRDPATAGAIVQFLDHPPALPVQVRAARPADPVDAAAILTLLDAYASDPRGGGQPLSAEVRARLIPGLVAHPTTRVWLAFDGERAVGICVGFVGFSTFRALPLLNLHDVAVLPDVRGRRVGEALLAAAEADARAAGYCKLTLEVQEDNTPARRLYERFGFEDVRYGDSGPTRFLVKPLPPVTV